jgi:isopenicillin N synthase-like dioxygenase
MASEYKTCSLPVIDISCNDAAKQIHDASKKYGFFIVTNHGVTSITKALQHSRMFFDLPDDIKKGCVVGHTGYTEPFTESLDTALQKVESKEGYYIRRPPDGVISDPLSGPNAWPSESLLPGWKNIMMDYYDEMMDLGKRISCLLVEGFGLESNFFSSRFSKSMSTLRLLHYNTEVSNPKEGIFGVGAHSDFGLMTMLATDDTPGLQIFIDGEWMNVPPRPADFVVNLGDIMQRWTNDYIKSTLHRVVNFSGSHRYSMPFFYEPDFDTVVECLPLFVDEQNPAKYLKTTTGQYFLDRIAETQPNHSTN